MRHHPHPFWVRFALALTQNNRVPRSPPPALKSRAARKPNNKKPKTKKPNPPQQSLVPLFADYDCPELAIAAWKAVDAAASSIPRELQAAHAGAAREAVATARERERRKRRAAAAAAAAAGGAAAVSPAAAEDAPIAVPAGCLAGLCLPPKALAPLLPLYLQAVLGGATPEAREAAAEGLGEIVEACSEAALRPFVVQITGPLIRIAGDRLAPGTRAALLSTLGLLLERAGAALKPFAPQLQSVFSRCLADGDQKVRAAAARNVGALSRLSARVDALAADLCAGAASGTAGAGAATDPEAAPAYLSALAGALAEGGARMSPPALAKARDAASAALLRAATAPGSSLVTPGGTGASGGDEAIARHALRAAAAACMAAYAGAVGGSDPAAAADAVVGGGQAGAAAADATGAALVLAAAARDPAARLRIARDPALLRRCQDAATKACRAPDAAVKLAGGRAAARLYLAAAAAGGAAEGGAAEGGAVGEALAAADPDPACLSGAMQTLLGPDQAPETSRQALLALRRLAEAVAAERRRRRQRARRAAAGGAAGAPPSDDAAAHGPPLPPAVVSEVLPSVCGLLFREPPTTVRAAGEHAVKALLALGCEADVDDALALAQASGGTVRSLLTPSVLRRIAKMAPVDPREDLKWDPEEY